MANTMNNTGTTYIENQRTMKRMMNRRKLRKKNKKKVNKKKRNDNDWKWKVENRKQIV